MGKKAYWTIEKIVHEIWGLMEKMELQHLPRYLELKEATGIDANTLQRFGGYKNISTIMGVPMAPRRMPKHYEKQAKTTSTWDELEPWEYRKSRADKIEAEMRKRKLHYSDWQTADTLKREAGIAW